MGTIKNISSGARGAWIGSQLVMVEPGATAEGDFTDVNPEWFASDAAPAEPGPLDGSVDELTAHLESVTDADEVQKLLDAETAGKSRKGAIAALEARRDAMLA